MNILLVIVSGFASGVALRSLFVFSWGVVASVVACSICFVVINRFKPRVRFVLAALFFAFVALGMIRSTLADKPLPQIFAAHLGERVQYTGVVVSDPDIREKNQRVTLEVRRGGESVRMLAVAKKDPVLSVGERVWVSGTLALPESFATEGGRTFRYDKYLEKDGVRFLLNFAYIRFDSAASWYSVPAFLAKIKHIFLDGLSSVLSNPYAALAGGIVIGGKTGLGNDVHDAFVKSGLVQIIVLSGYNVMVVATWIMNLLSLTPLSRRWVTISGGAALLVFVGIAGFSATAVRAMLMALIALFARMTGKTYDAGRALLIVVLLMLIWNPLYLVFDPGFGLSVAATAGLIWFTPLIERRFVWIRSTFLREIVSTTLAAQIAVLPILLYDMGIFSVVAIPANILVAPLVPLAMGWSVIAGFAGILFGHVFPLLGNLFAAPSYVLTWAIIAIATTSASLPWSTVVFPAFPFWIVLLTYGFLIYRARAASKRFSATDQFTLAKKAST